jgi:hypothetical protein
VKPTATTTDSTRSSINMATKLALGVSVGLLALRMSLADMIGFGDAEALYAVYARYRQATYLEHPGLIGWVGSWVSGDGSIPSPNAAHRFTAAAAMAVPWIAGLAARASGATWRGAMWTIVALLVVPEFAVGLYAFTPDVPLGLLWATALTLAIVALKNEASSPRALGATVGAGLVTGLACTSKLSGVLLGIALLATWLSGPLRKRWKTLAPWAAVVCFGMVVAPMVLREWRLGNPMLHHRLLATQAGFGPTMRNLGALLGGQVLYVTPFALFAAVLVARDLVKRHRDDDVGRLLILATFIPLVALSVLMLLSKVAEPHWLAPAYVALAVHLGRRVDCDSPIISRRLMIASLVSSIAAIALVFVTVRFPLLPKVLGKHYQARYDLTNDLFAWKDGNRLVREAVDDVRESGISSIAVVGPHWVVCAQVKAGLGSSARVGCETDVGDDFDTFYPRAEWRKAKVLLYVTDDRYDVDPRNRFPDLAVQSVSRVGVRRGGVLIRTIRVTRLGRAGAG